MSTFYGNVTFSMRQVQKTDIVYDLGSQNAFFTRCSGFSSEDRWIVVLMESFNKILSRLGAQLIGYGPPGDDQGLTCAMAEDFGAYEAEYAAIRRHVGIFHLPQTGLIRATGDDRVDFLHRMTTQDINAMTGGQTRRAFQLCADGKIVGDLFVHHGDACTWLECDRFDIKPVMDLLDARLFSEDVTLADISDTRQAIALLGPASIKLLDAVAVHTCEGMAPASVGEMPGTTHVVKIGEHLVSCCRRDLGSTLGLRLFVPSEGLLEIYQALLDAAGYETTDPEQGGDDFANRRRAGLRGRPVGWAAYNTARIESGLPMFHIDYGPDSLPAELGKAVFEEAVSMTKGCYLGQEAVARMHNLSHPKRALVGLKLHADHLPVAGTQVFEVDPDKRAKAPRGGQIGGVTSSTVSPLLGTTAVAFAVMKWGKHRPGTMVALASSSGDGGGEMVQAEVCGIGFLD